MNLVLRGRYQQAIHGVNTTSDMKSFDLPFSALLSPLEITEVYHSNHDVGTPFGISNHEEVDVFVAQGWEQVVILDILGNIALEIIKCFAVGLASSAFFSFFSFFSREVLAILSMKFMYMEDSSLRRAALWSTLMCMQYLPQSRPFSEYPRLLPYSRA